MRKTIIILLALIMLVSCAACGSPSSAVNSAPAESPAQSAEPPVNEPPEEEPQEEPPAAEAPQEEGVLPLEVKECGYALSGDQLYYSVCLYNPNDSYLLEYPTYRISARDAEGDLLGSKEHTLPRIYPHQEFWYAYSGFSVEEVPAAFEVEVLPPEDYDIVNVELAEHPEYIPLEVTGTEMRDGILVGEVKNNNDYDISYAIVTAVFRDEDGNLIGGDSNFVDGIPAGGTAQFYIDLYMGFVTDNCEVYANNWG